MVDAMKAPYSFSLRSPSIPPDFQFFSVTWMLSM
jgi:hypothetical protein